MHPHFSHLENSERITDIPTSGPVVRNHILSKMADGENAARRTTYHSLSLVYRHALEAQLHLHLRQSVLQEAVIPTLRPASTRSKSTSGTVRVLRRMNQQKPKTQTKLRQRVRMVRPVACLARMVRIIYGKSCGRKSSSIQGRTREFS